MKKWMTILVVFALCGAAMAQNITANSTAAEQIKLNKGKQDYINFKTDGTLGSSGLSYTVVTSSHPGNRFRKDWKIVGYEQRWSNRQQKWVDDTTKPIYEQYYTPTSYDYDHRVAQLYFTTANQDYLDAYNAEHSAETGKTMSKVVVQFAGAQIEWGSNEPASNWIQDYGIYLLDSNGEKVSDYLSITSGNKGIENYFELDPNQNFGVYYKNVNGDYVTTTDNWIGNYDTGNHPTIAGANEIKEYDDEGNLIEGGYTYKKFMCLFKTDQPYLNDITHWEFMLQTTLDDPYYKVNPEDFQGNGETFSNHDNAPVGQPLPGTLATLLIGGLCAGTLRKKNKKH